MDVVTELYGNRIPSQANESKNGICMSCVPAVESVSYRISSGYKITTLRGLSGGGGERCCEGMH
jgi:hypothetical protein